MKIENDSLKFFAFDISLPDETWSRFGIFHDLAELFGLEFNADAVKQLRSALKEFGDAKSKVSIDREADNVSITASKAEDILAVAKCINDLSLPEFRKLVDERTDAELRHDLVSWRRRKPKKWREGDVFAISLSDGTFTFGQVLAVQYRAPTCCLFNYRAKSPDRDVEEIIRSKVLTVLHLGSDCLDKGEWQVVSNRTPCVSPHTGPGGRQGEVGSTSYGGGHALADFAEAYWGLAPWNVYHDESYFDKLLMPGIERPRHAKVLSPQERTKYRQDKGWNR